MKAKLYASIGLVAALGAVALSSTVIGTTAFAEAMFWDSAETPQTDVGECPDCPIDIDAGCTEDFINNEEATAMTYKNNVAANPVGATFDFRDSTSDNVNTYNQCV